MKQVEVVEGVIKDLEKWKGARHRKELDVTALCAAISLLKDYREVLNMDPPSEDYGRELEDPYLHCQGE